MLVVILIFLQDWRAMLVPATTVPVTIIGAFAAMAALGFTINLSTLFAIVLAIGIVVDDAIVVVEGAAHNIEKGMSGHDAAISAMDQLFAPIIGITLVLISVFLPAAFLPGLTGRIYAQFALVIAATALLSAVNAATLKPTQCALWLRPAVPMERRNRFYRGFNAVYARLERGYAGLIGRMVAYSGSSAVIALVLIGIGVYGLSRVPTGFLPIEDQGYLLAAVQLPDGASLERTQQVLDRVSEIAGKTPGVAQVIGIAGISALDNSASLANGGVAYLILKDWDARGPGEDLRSLVVGLNQKMAGGRTGADHRASAAADPGDRQCRRLRHAGRAARRQRRFRQAAGHHQCGGRQRADPERAATCESPFRAMVPQFESKVDRVKTQTLHVTTDQVFSTLASYLGSSYVDQFNKFGRTFQIYTQADAQFRLTPRDIAEPDGAQPAGRHDPARHVATITPAVGPSLISLYNLYPSSTVIGLPAQGYSSGQSIEPDGADRRQDPAAGTGYEWTAMSYQEKAVGSQIYYVFGLAMLLVYLVLAGQYESWYAPISVMLAVPLSLLGPMAVLTALRVDNNLYIQIGLILLIALSAKNAILIVEVARELHAEGKPIVEVGGRGGAGALPSDPDDVVRLHPRRGAAGGGDRRRRQRAQVDRHHGVPRHDRLDLPGRAVRAVVLRRHPALRKLACNAEAKEDGDTIVRCRRHRDFILRDASLRDAPQDEGRNLMVRSSAMPRVEPGGHRPVVSDSDLPEISSSSRSSVCGPQPPIAIDHHRAWQRRSGRTRPWCRRSAGRNR